MKNMGYSQIVIDCSAEKTLTVLKQAQQLGMTGSYHSYLLTSLVSENVKSINTNYINNNKLIYFC